MVRTMMKGKIHRATVTESNLDYEGSITIDQTLLDMADIMEYEQVQIYNVTNGERFTTYAIRGERGSGVMCINGAAAHKARKGDLIIVATYAGLDEQELVNFEPKKVYVDALNRPKAGSSGYQSKLTAVH